MSVNEQLDAFVKRGLEQRLDRAHMEQALLEAGWPPDQVRQALAAYVDVDFPIPVPRPLPSATTRDAFMYIIVLGTMVLCAYQFGALVFEIINRLVPDAMDARRYATGKQRRDTVVGLDADRRISGVRRDVAAGGSCGAGSIRRSARHVSGGG